MSEYKPFIFKLDGGDNKILDRPVTKKRYSFITNYFLSSFATWISLFHS